MDSDKRGGTSKVNETKLSAAAAASGSWVTEGREIENYLPPDVAENMFGKPLAKYDSVSSVHEEYKKTRLDKKKTAAEAVSMLTLENWCHRNLKEEIGKLVHTISGWNPVYIEEDIT